MAEETRQGRSIKIKPTILRKAHHRAIESQKRLGVWIEEAIEEKATREERAERQQVLLRAKRGSGKDTPAAAGETI